MAIVHALSVVEYITRSLPAALALSALMCIPSRTIPQLASFSRTGVY